MNAQLQPLEMRFRPMREADLDELIRIERAAYPYPWTLGNFRDCLGAGYSCWVGEMEGMLAGYWLMMQALDEGHILNCCIAPRWQRRGLGRQLMAHLFETARGHNTRSLFLEVRLSNTPAKRLYESLGFEAVGQRRGYYPTDTGREDALVMRLGL
ncbi:MAG: ribosomal protein S18-alanine N-acetyltransferase [Pseudomonadota bacterium]